MLWNKFMKGKAL